MLPYFLLLFVSAVFPFLLNKKRTIYIGYCDDEFVQKRNKMTLIVFFVGFFLLLSLRDITVGKDLYTYKKIFESCISASFEDLPKMQWELGYTVFCKLFSFVSHNFRFFLIVVSAITLIPIYKLYSNEGNFGFLLIVLFINMPSFLIIFSGLRQAIAISVGVLAYLALKKKKPLYSIVLMLLAISFHVSAAVLVLIYPAYYLKIKAKNLLWIVPVLVGVFIFRIPLLTLLIGFLPNKYIDFYGEVQSTGAWGMMILFLIFITFSFVVLDEDKMSKKDYFMRNILLIATVFQFFVPIHGLIQRASYYFLIFVPLSIASVVRAPKRWLNSISNTAIVVLTIFFFVYFFYNSTCSTNNLLDVFPYSFFWEGRS